MAAVISHTSKGQLWAIDCRANERTNGASWGRLLSSRPGTRHGYVNAPDNTRVPAMIRWCYVARRMIGAAVYASPLPPISGERRPSFLDSNALTTRGGNSSVCLAAVLPPVV